MPRLIPPTSVLRSASGRRRLPASAALILSIGLVLPALADATMYKCRNASGALEYRDHPCPGRPDSRPFVPQDRLTVVPADSLTGQSARSGSGTQDKRPGWIKELAPDPIGHCTRRGGTIDRELRACMLP